MKRQKKKKKAKLKIDPAVVLAIETETEPATEIATVIGMTTREIVVAVATRMTACVPIPRFFLN